MGKTKGGQSWIQPVSQQQQQHPTPVQPTMKIQAPSLEDIEGGSIDILSQTIHTLNSNPYLIGMFMLILNLGGRYLSMELSEKQEAFLQQRWLRPLLFFIVIFIGTRNLAVAFWTTMALFMILWVLANEKSPWCLIPSWREEENAKAPTRTQNYEVNMEAVENIQQRSFVVPKKYK